MLLDATWSTINLVKGFAEKTSGLFDWFLTRPVLPFKLGNQTWHGTQFVQIG